MDVFDSAVGPGGAVLRDAAVAAGHELGVFDAMTRGSVTLDELGHALDLPRGSHRLRALIDVLAAIGAIGRDGERFALCAAPPPCPVVVPAGWGVMAEVIRRDRPLVPGGREIERRFHRHLFVAGAAAARELVPLLGTSSLLDLGGGAGAYTYAFLDANPQARATLVDARAVLALAAAELAGFATRVQLVAGDARTAPVGNGHGAVLLSNLLHLHAPEVCAELCATAARAVAPGGVVAIKDLRVDPGRCGPIEGLLFALNMAIYTAAGDVYEPPVLRGWLEQAGLVGIEERRLAAAPDAVVILGYRP